jgi:GNAT superfamily N-acetyltransferase
VSGAGPMVEPCVRRARPDDAAALAEMFGRCSRQTRYERFHGVVAGAAYLRRCLDSPGAFVAEVGTGLVGFADTAPVPGAPHIHEAGVLVEDGWQRRGVGRRLLARLLADTPAELIRLELCRERRWLVAYVFAHAKVVASRGSGCDVTVDVLTNPAAGPAR